MSLLDNIIETGHVSDQSASERIQAIKQADTDFAVAKFGRALPFRGMLKDVRGTSNGELLVKADLAWKVHTMPVLAQKVSTKETKVCEGYQALVRGDNGDILSVTSDQFKAHQNSEILDDMREMADAGQAEILFAGGLDKGRKVVAIAKLDGEFELPNKRDNEYRNDHAGANFNDKTHLFAVISGGHEVGTPFKIRGMAFRQWCGNGAFFTVDAKSTYTRSHRLPLGRYRETIVRCYQSIREEFGNYSVNAARLQQIAMDREQSRLYVAELLKPGITAEIGARLHPDKPFSNTEVWEEVALSLRGRQVLNTLLKESEDVAGFARTGKHLLDAIVEQDGANGANLWSGYNGITWHVDHKRGRSDDSGMDAALFGAGATLKEHALETALQFVPATVR